MKLLPRADRRSRPVLRRPTRQGVATVAFYLLGTLFALWLVLVGNVGTIVLAYLVCLALLAVLVYLVPRGIGLVGRVFDRY